MRKAILPYVGLPNILAGGFIVPEILQQDATAENLAQALGNGLDNKEARLRLRERFARMHESLAQGHDERVVQALEPFLNPLSATGAHANAQGNGLAALRG